MKTRSVWAAGVFFLLTVISANAQNAGTVAKVLPTNTKGVIKLLVCDNPGKSVKVKFFGDEGLIATDDIQGKDAQGFTKKYDLNRLAYKSFQMKIDTEYASFTYQITKDGRGVVAELRETTQTFPVLAAR